jgi:hypothetical protein
MPRRSSLHYFGVFFCVRVVDNCHTGASRVQDADMLYYLLTCFTTPAIRVRVAFKTLTCFTIC